MKKADFVDGMKVCSGCRIPQPSSNFCKRTVSFDGLSQRCRSCKSSADTLRRKQNPEKIKAAGVAYYRKNRDRLIASTARWGKEHPDKRSEYSRRRYRKNPDKYKAANAIRGKSERHKEICARWRKENKEKCKAMIALWQSEHPESRRAASYRSNNKRRALKLGNGVGDPVAMADFRKYVYTARKIRCYWCKQWVPKGKRHVDHIIPLAKGGPEAEWNLCCACVQCNSAKGAKDPGEFSGQHELPLFVERGLNA